MSKYPNEFAAWRVSFQNDRQAAESAFDDLIENAHELNQLDMELREERRKVERLRAAALKMLNALNEFAGPSDEETPETVRRAHIELEDAYNFAEPNDPQPADGAPQSDLSKGGLREYIARLVGVPRIAGVPEAAFVWNDPDEAGRYPRVGGDGSVATRGEYDFSPASIGQVRALFNRMVSAALETERRKLERLRSAALELHHEIESWGYLSHLLGEAKSRLLQALISSEPGK